VKDHAVGDLPAAPPAVSPLKHLFFGICIGDTEISMKFSENFLKI